MASYMYPPIVNSSAPAFSVKSGKGEFKLYFSKSKYASSSYTIGSVHISIINQKTGRSVLNSVDNLSSGRYRSKGYLILNSQYIEEDDNGQFVKILGEDINNGWVGGQIYKFQIRTTQFAYNSNSNIDAMTRNGSLTEWSSYCSVKAITEPVITIPIFDYIDNEFIDDNEEKIYNLASDMVFSATYNYAEGAENEGENLYSYRVTLYSDDSDDILDDSGDLYASLSNNVNTMSYNIKYLFKENIRYYIQLTYVTQNKYTKTITNSFTMVRNSMDVYEDIYIVTADNLINNLDHYHSIHDGKAEYGLLDGHSSYGDATAATHKKDAIDALIKAGVSIDNDDDEGRIAIKLYNKKDETILMQSYILRRTDSKSNYTIWEDIHYFNFNNEKVDSADIYYDYTIESGVYYKYCMQAVNSKGYRSTLKDDLMTEPIIRNFHHAFLLGEGGKQLKIKFNNQMNSYTYTILEQKSDTIGGVYPFISRNNDVKYRTFPLNGLISFYMDDCKTFLTNADLYGSKKWITNSQGELVNEYDNIIKQYDALQEKYGKYDYIHEHDFREAVLDFLQDGKPKLYKSSTEGNIIVYLMGVSAQPDQSRGRLIASFTSTAYEIAKPTLKNYLKYGFYNVGEVIEDYSTSEYKIGQIDLYVKPNKASLIKEIWKKYDASVFNNGGYSYTLDSIFNVSIEFLSRPRVIQSNPMITGYKLTSSKVENEIYINSLYGNIYEFDENIVFKQSDTITFVDGIESDDEQEDIHILVNFIYKLKQEPYALNQVAVKTYSRGVGQWYGSVDALGRNLSSEIDDYYDIYADIYLKYFYNITDNKGLSIENKTLNKLDCISIEADPGTVFKIGNETENEEIIMNNTGMLVVDNYTLVNYIRYLGYYDSKGNFNKGKKDIIVNYLYFTIKNFY